MNETFAGKVVLPGFIDQHLHPILGALTLSTEVIAPEDWVMPERTFKAAATPAEYLAKLKAAEAAMKDKNEWLYTWGYHKLWHGNLDRTMLDAVSATRPIVVWQRSCHEFYLNTAAIKALGLTEEAMQGQGRRQQDDELGGRPLVGDRDEPHPGAPAQGLRHAGALRCSA